MYRYNVMCECHCNAYAIISTDWRRACAQIVNGSNVVHRVIRNDEGTCINLILQRKSKTSFIQFF